MKARLIAVLLVCSAIGMFAQDRSFYQSPDKDDWPGDTLSEKQFLKAVEHFKDPAFCSKPPRWALIGSYRFLLKGTDYSIHLVGPYINLSQGYWGGSTYDAAWLSLREVEAFAEKQARNDCRYGHKDAQP